MVSIRNGHDDQWPVHCDCDAFIYSVNYEHDCYLRALSAFRNCIGRVSVETSNRSHTMNEWKVQKITNRNSQFTIVQYYWAKNAILFALIAFLHSRSERSSGCNVIWLMRRRRRRANDWQFVAFFILIFVFLLLLFGIAYASKDWNERNPKIGMKCVRYTLLVSLLRLILTLTRCMCTEYLFIGIGVLCRVCVALCERVRRKRCSEVNKTKEIAVWLGFVALFRALTRTQSA